jgi:outer membrane autotransporter protein
MRGKGTEGEGKSWLGSSERTEAPMASAIDIWTEGHFSRYSDSDGGGPRDGEFGVVYVGADALLHPDLLVGALVQFDWASENGPALNALSYDARGNGWMAGPYVSARLTDNLFFDARAAWGQSSNDIDIPGVTGSFDTERWLVSGNLTGNWQSGPWRLTPSLGVTYAEETQERYVTSLGAKMPARSVALGRIAFGPEIAYRMDAGKGMILEPFGSIVGLWDFDRPENLTQAGFLTGTDEFRGKVEAGLMLSMQNGMKVRASGNYDGIGAGDFDAYGGQLWVSIPLQ